MSKRLKIAMRALGIRLGVFILALTITANVQKAISAIEARNHIGQRATVCGNVASAHYAASSRGNPTFINLDKPYPNQVFTVLIWGSDRPRFGQPDQSLRGKHVCITGTIGSYRGTPEIIAQNPNEISVQ